MPPSGSLDIDHPDMDPLLLCPHCHLSLVASIDIQVHLLKAPMPAVPDTHCSVRAPVGYVPFTPPPSSAPVLSPTTNAIAKQGPPNSEHTKGTHKGTGSKGRLMPVPFTPIGSFMPVPFKHFGKGNSGIQLPLPTVSCNRTPLFVVETDDEEVPDWSNDSIETPLPTGRLPPQSSDDSGDPDLTQPPSKIRKCL
jgi:hypothetical protein